MMIFNGEMINKSSKEEEYMVFRRWVCEGRSKKGWLDPENGRGFSKFWCSFTTDDRGFPSLLFQSYIRDDVDSVAVRVNKFDTMKGYALIGEVFDLFWGRSPIKGLEKSWFRSIGEACENPLLSRPYKRKHQYECNF